MKKCLTRPNVPYVAHLVSRLGLLFALVLLPVLSVYTYTRAPAPAYAATSSTLNFQARLMSSAGNTVPDGYYNIQFNLYDVSSGGSSLWTETRDFAGTDDRVRIVNGFLSVNLGSVTSLPNTINWDQEHWLGMTIRGAAACDFATTCTPADSEMSPRLKLTAVPYAFRAGQADNVRSSNTTTASTNSANITIQSGNTTGATSNSGNITLDVGTATGTAGTISIGTVNTSGITLGRAGITSILQGSLRFSALNCTGNANGGALTASATGELACSDDDGGAGGGGTLQQAYTADADGSDAIIALTTADGGVLIRDNATPIASTLFAVQSSAAANFLSVSATAVNLGVDTTVAAGKSLTVVGGVTGTRPGSPTEGMFYYDQTLDQMLVYANGKWQADRTTATKIVAASNSQNPEKADYLADGTDDQDTINTAIAALPAGGGIVYLLEGTYIIDDGADNDDRGIEFDKSNITIAGSGNNTIVQLKSSINANLDAFANTDASTRTGQKIRDIVIDGNKAGQTSGTQNGIRVMYAGSSTVRGLEVNNVTVKNFRNIGIEFPNGGNGQNHLIKDVHLIANTAEGLVSWAADTKIIGSYAQGNTGDGFNVENDRISITNSTAISNGGDGFDLTNCDNCLISNSISSTNTGAGIYSLFGDGSSYVGNIVKSNTSHGIRIRGADNLISSNTVDANGGHGVYIDNSADNNTITSNRIHNNGSTGSSSGIYIEAFADRVQIVSNKITDTAGTGCAINFDTTFPPTNPYLAGNVYSGTGATTICNLPATAVLGGQIDSNADYVMQGSRTVIRQDTELLNFLNTGYGGIGQFGNLLTYSEQQDNAAWTKTSVTVTADNTAAPDNQTTAELLNTTVANGTVDQASATAIGATHTFSIWLKSNSTSNRNITLRIDGSTTGTGTAKTVSVPNVWTRYFVTQNTSGFTGNVKVVILGPATSDDVYAWGAQLIAGSSMGVYAETVASTVTADSGIISNGSLRVVDSGTFGGDLAVNGGDITSIGALNVTPGGALTLGATGQTALLQGTVTTITSNGAGNDIILTSADKIILTGFNCTGNTNGGALTASATGELSCSDDDGGAGGGGTLQAAYDASTSPATILLSAADDNLLFQNPASGGLDVAGAPVLKIENLATGNVEGLRVESAGTGNLFTVRDTTATATDTFKIADGGAITAQNQTNSTSAFQVQNAAGYQLLNMDSTVDSANLITNGSAEANTTGWTAKNGSGTSTLTQVTAQAYIGTGAMQVATTGADASNAGASWSRSFTNNQWYAFTVFAKLNSGSFSTFQLGNSNNNSTDTSCLTAQTLSTGGWARFTCTFQYTGTTGTSYVYFKQTNATNQTYFIDGAKLETVSGSSSIGTPYKEAGISLATNVTSAITFQNQADSTNAFQIQNVAGTGNLFNVDTLNSRVNFGTVPSGSSTSKVTIAGSCAACLAIVPGSGLVTDSGFILMNNRATFGYDGTYQGVLFSDAAATKPIIFANGNNAGSAIERLRIDTSGNLGVGTGATVSALLHVSGAGGGASLFRVTDTTATARDVLDIADGGATTLRNQADSTAAFRIQNTSAQSLLTADTTNRRITLDDGQAALANLFVLDSSSVASTAVAGGMYFDTGASQFKCSYNGSTFVNCGAGGTTLQDAYNASSTPATILLSAADDNLLFQNPASGGLDVAGAPVLKIENLATGNVEGLRVESAGTGNLFTVRDTTATATDTFKIADGGAITAQNQTNSTSAFAIKNAAGSSLLNLSTSTGARLEVVGDIVSKGTEWTSRTNAAANQWRAITYGNGLFVAISTDGTGNRVMTSPDGINWTSRTSAADNSWRSVTYGNGLFVAVSISGIGNRVMTSPDGINWTSRTSAVDNAWTGVVYGNGLFVAVSNTGTGDRVMTSPDGITWTTRTSSADNQWHGLAYGNGLFVAVSISGIGNRVMTSPDGITWTTRTSVSDTNWQSVTYGNGLFVAVSSAGGTNRVMTSPDGVTWTLQTTPDGNGWFSVTYGNGLYVAVAQTGTNRVMTSPDGVTWTSRTSAADNLWQGVAYGNGLFAAVSLDGTGNRVMTSGKADYIASQDNNIYQGGITVRSGSALFNSGAGSTTAFQIQNASAQSLFTADTTNRRITLDDGQAALANLFVLDSSSVAPTAVAGGMYFNGTKFRCSENGSTFVDCIGAGGGGTLQSAYDSSTTPATILISAADDNLLFQNPASGGLDVAGAPVLKIENLATGNVEGLRVESAGTGNLFTVRDTTATATDTFKIADGGAATFQNQTNSAAAFQVQDAAGTSNAFVVDTSNTRVGVGVAAPLASLHVSATGAGGALFRVTDTTATAADVLNIADGGAITAKNQANSAAAFQVQKADGNEILTADTTNSQVLFGKASTLAGKLVVYSAGSANTITITSGTTSASYNLILPTSAGNANECLKNSGTAGTLTFGSCGGGTKRITLVPEYSGGTLTPDGSSNSGTMTADFVSGLSAGQGYKHNFYEWSTDQSGAQDYDIVVNYQIPSDFSAFGSASFRIWTYVDTTTSTDVTFMVRDVDGTACYTSAVSVKPSTGATWEEINPGNPANGCTFAANDIITFIIKPSAITPQTNKVRVGELRFEY